jgi:hypothetical protein
MKAGDVQITDKQPSYYENFDHIFRKKDKQEPYGGRPSFMSIGLPVLPHDYIYPVQEG